MVLRTIVRPSRADCDGFRWDRLGWDERFRCFVYGGFLHARPEAVVVGISAQFQGFRGEGGGGGLRVMG